MSARDSAARKLEPTPRAATPQSEAPVARPRLVPPPSPRTGTLTDRFIARCRHSILRTILRLTESFPAEDPHDLVWRLRRAAASIPTGISAGGAPSGGASQRLLDAAQSATAEVKYLASLSGELGYAPRSELEPLLGRISDIRKVVQHVRERSARQSEG